MREGKLEIEFAEGIRDTFSVRKPRPTLSTTLADLLVLARHALTLAVDLGVTLAEIAGGALLWDLTDAGAWFSSRMYSGTPLAYIRRPPPTVMTAHAVVINESRRIEVIDD
jgi:hypothetical protein